MPTVTNSLRKHLLSTIGYSLPVDNLETLKRTRWSRVFELLMRNRLIMGSFRYGPWRPGRKERYDYMKSIIQRAEAYKFDSNKEHLVDIANIAMVEFVVGDGRWESKDDSIHAETR